MRTKHRGSKVSAVKRGLGELSEENTTWAEESRAIRETEDNLVEGVGPNFGSWLKTTGATEDS